MIILCACGIGYLGYLIFMSKNIEKVELTGNIQTLYIVGDEIDFEDSKLKVTYKTRRRRIRIYIQSHNDLGCSKQR